MSADHRKRRTLRLAAREIGLILAFGALVLVLVALGAGVVSRSVARQQALSEANRATRALANLVVAPLLPDDLEDLANSSEALDQALNYGLAEGPLLDVTIWRVDGHVVYSTNAAANGRTFVPPPEVGLAIGGTSTSAAEEPGSASTALVAGGAPSPVRPGESYVKVYVPLTVLENEPLAIEAYYGYQTISGITEELLTRFLPLILAPLILLQLIQLPAALSLANRLRRKEDEREQLFTRALDVADRERASFAADLHDGPIQDLAGVSYALGALAPAVPAPQAALMARIQAAVQRSVEALRSLMTDLYPPDLSKGTLAQAVATLAQPLREAGVQVDLDLDELPDLHPETAVTLYRVTREVLANVEKHARATQVTVTASASAEAQTGGDDLVRLVITDNGIGADPRRLDRRREGHLGLRLVIDRVHNAGGQLTLTSAPGKGTRVETELPTQHS